MRSAKQAIGKALHVFETERPTRDELLAQISGDRTAAIAADERLKTFVEASGCEVIDDTAHVDTATLYGAYFEGSPPFGSGSKKNEFPDALALNALESEGANRQTKLIVVSKDRDWRAFCEKSQRLYLVPDIERALALINDAPVIVREAVQTWLAEGAEGRAEVTARLEGKVEQIEFSVDGNATSGEMEAIPYSGELTSVTWPRDDEIDIIDVVDADEGEAKNVTLSLPLKLKLLVPIELSFSMWDSVDRESIGMGGRTVEVDQELDVRVTMTLNVYNLGGEIPGFEVDDIELDDLFHNVELGNVDVFEPEDYD